MTVKIKVSFEVAIDSPGTLTAYGIALGYALKSAAANAVKVADQPGAEVRMGAVNLDFQEMGAAWPILH